MKSALRFIGRMDDRRRGAVAATDIVDSANSAGSAGNVDNAASGESADAPAPPKAIKAGKLSIWIGLLGLGFSFWGFELYLRSVLNDAGLAAGQGDALRHTLLWAWPWLVAAVWILSVCLRRFEVALARMLGRHRSWFLGSDASPGASLSPNHSDHMALGSEADATEVGAPLSSPSPSSSQAQAADTSNGADFEAILEGLAVGVVGLLANDNVAFINATARRDLELGSVQPRQTLLELVRSAELMRLVARARRKHRIVEGTLERFGRTSQTFRVRVTPLQTLGEVVLVFHNETEVRQLERVRRDFVANVSHELRTPVSVIQANAETLLNGALDDPKHNLRFVQAIDRNAERLAALISDLLDLSQIEGGASNFVSEPVILQPLVERVLQSLELKLQKLQQSVTVNIPQGAAVVGDMKALEQVWVNLIDNALKYAGEGGSIELVAHQDGDTFEMGVADNGPGIPEALRERVFERFFRIDPGRSRDVGGTGLGLSIVRHLIEAMGGQVGVRDAASGGALFVFCLPAADTQGDETFVD